MNIDFGSVVGAAQSSTKTVGLGKYLAVWDVSAGAGNVSLQIEFSSGNWVTLATKTADGIQEFSLPSGSYRVDVAAATTAQIKLFQLVP